MPRHIREKQYAEFILPYYNEIYIYISAKVENSIIAEDILQATFESAWKAISTLQDLQKSRSWLYSIARRKMIDHYKHAKNHKYITSFYDEENGDISESLKYKYLNPEYLLISSEKINNLIQAIHKLPQRSELIIQLHCFEGLSYYEIAKLLKITPENARVIFYRARRRLYKILQDEDYDFNL